MNNFIVLVTSILDNHISAKLAVAIMLEIMTAQVDCKQSLNSP